MENLLADRLSGGLVGMYLAQKVRPIYDESRGPTEDALRQQHKNTFKTYALLVGASVESLIHCRGVNVEDWVVATGRLLEGDGHAIALAPIAFYLQDDLPRLQQTVRAVGDRYRLDGITVDSLLFLATSLGLIYGREASAQTLIPQTLAALPGLDKNLIEQLQLVQDLGSEGDTLSTINSLMAAITRRQQPYLLPVAMASYCHLTTPHSYVLGVQRSVRIPRQPFITQALVGLLLGSTGGIALIPASWYTEGIRGADQLIQLSDRLLASWAGVHSLSQTLGQNLVHGVVAAPGILQRRDPL